MVINQMFMMNSFHHIDAVLPHTVPGWTNEVSILVQPGFSWVDLYQGIVGSSLFHYILIATSILFITGISSAMEPALTSLPSTTTPLFIGERFLSQVPDTLDLAERMKLSLNAITRCVNGPPKNPFPETHHLCNHFIDMSTFPPRILRNVDLYGKYMLGALLARMVTGSEDNLKVDDDWRRAWLQFQEINPVMSGPEGGRWLEWMAFNIQREHEPNRSAWLTLAQRAVSRLNEAAVTYLDGAWIVTSNNIPDDGFSSREAALDVLRKLPETLSKSKYTHPQGYSASGDTWTLQGLCAIYRETRNPEALNLARRIAHYLKDYANIVAPDGRFLAEVPPGAVHWHHSFQAALSCAEYGLVSGEQEFLEFAHTTYKHAMTFCNRVVGFAPEYCYGRFPRDQNEDNIEACCCADLILMALWLSVSDIADYWDDVDRYIRNHISTLQLTSTSWFYNLPYNRGNYQWPDPSVEAVISPFTGQFGGWATANEWLNPRYGPGIMTCCVGNCTRAFYYVLSRMMDCSEETLRIHLLLNAANHWAEIMSYQPYAGRCDIVPKTEYDHILVRMPEWIPKNADGVIVFRNNKQIPLSWRGRYIDVGPGEPNQPISIQFPITVQEFMSEIGRHPYTLTVKGNTVVSIDPKGDRIPLYQREKYMLPEAPMVSVNRFIGEGAK